MEQELIEELKNLTISTTTLYNDDCIEVMKKTYTIKALT